MSFYENIFIARQDLSTNQVQGLIDSYVKFIKEHDGKVEEPEYWGLRTLAHSIKKNARGHYVLLKIEAPAATMNELDRQMRFNENVLRSLTVKVNELEKGPSVVMRAPKERASKDAKEDTDE